MDVNGLSRSHPDHRNLVRRRVLALTTAAGVAAVGATGLVTLALAPAGTTVAAATTSSAKAPPAPATLAPSPAASLATPSPSATPPPPVATSGGS